MVRIYLMPLITTGSRRSPKYASDYAGFGYDVVDYGYEPACLVGVQDVSDPVHAALVAHPDVVALPTDLDQQIGAQLALVQNALAALNIPENWVQAAWTYRQVLRVVALIFTFSQRFNGILPNVRIFDSGITLDTHINQLNPTVRAALNSAATSYGFDTSGLTGTQTLRSALKAMADQFSTIEFLAFGMVL